MKKLYLPLLIILTVIPAMSVADPIDKVASLIRQGNIHGLSSLFAESIEVSILGEENVYSKVQAELIFDKFFNQNKPRSVKILHNVNSNPNYRFGVLIVNTERGVYRITFTLKGTGDDLALISFRIETEKVR